MSEKICRLCLQTISNNNYKTIWESMLKTLKLHLKISEESVMCIECAHFLRVLSKFTPGCSNVDDEALPIFGLQNDVKLEPVETEATSNPQSLIKTEIKCSFCAETHGREDLISLNESKENKFLVNTLEQYISETNFKNTGELLTCETCLGALQGVLNFILNCLDVEENISKYIELNGTDKGQIELKEVQQFMFRPILKLEIESFGVNEIEGRCNEIKEENSTMAETEIKYEKEISHPEMIIITEDANIKSEPSDCDGLQEPFIENDPNDPLHIPVVTSETSEYKEHIKQQLLTHKISSETKMFKCELCSYGTKRKRDLKRHILIHKSPSDIKMFKCDLCSYEAKYKSGYKSHLLTHKSHSEIETFKCALCSYEAKRKCDLKMHLLTHKNPSEIEMFKCESCSYKTKHRSVLKSHSLSHKYPSELKMFKCELCLYETKRKIDLERHILTHKSPSEITMFKCALCSFEAKRKCDLKMHLLTHKDPSEVKMFKCELCSYETKRKSYLNKHILIHKGPSDINMFKCELCTYEAKQKSYLNRHLLTHKNTSEIEMFKCSLCSYEGKRKYDLKMHLLTHKNPSEIEMFKH